MKIHGIACKKGHSAHFKKIVQGAALLGFIGIFAWFLPEITRYMKIRNM